MRWSTNYVNFRRVGGLFANYIFVAQANQTENNED